MEIRATIWQGKEACKMEEKNSIYIFDDRLLFSAFNNGLYGRTIESANSDDQNRERDVTMVETDLPAEHLTATYWG